MRTVLLGVVAVLLLLSGYSVPQIRAILAPVEQSSAVATTTPQGTYAVVRVVDGDTLVIKKDEKDVKVRLIGVDTPEVVDPRKPVQCFGTEASAAAHAALDGKQVRVETDSSQSMYDAYSRLLAYVFLPDGTLFNQYLIAEGYGHEYTFNTPYRYQDAFKAAERTARESKKGLWADGVCSS